MKSGLWDGTGVLDFSRVFTPDPTHFVDNIKPIPYYFSLRTWRILNLAQGTTTSSATTSSASKTTSEEIPLYLSPFEYPFSVPLEKSVLETFTRETLMAWHSDLYEGTEFDLTKGALSGPFGSPFPVEGGVVDGFGSIPRGISIGRTTYSVIGESPVVTDLEDLDSNSRKPVAWFAADTPATSVFVPYLAGTTQQSAFYQKGVQTSFSRDSAFWAFSFVNNFAKIMYNEISSRDIYPLRRELQGKVVREYEEKFTNKTDDGLRVNNKWQTEVQERVVERWWQLADLLPAKYNDNYVFFPTKSNLPADWAATKPGYPAEWTKEVGINQDPHPIFVQRRFEKEELGDNFSPGSRNVCPVAWNPKKAIWSYLSDDNVLEEMEKGNREMQELGIDEGKSFSLSKEATKASTGAGGIGMGILMGLLLGFGIGGAGGWALGQAKAKTRITDPIEAGYLRL